MQHPTTLPPTPTTLIDSSPAARPDGDFQIDADDAAYARRASETTWRERAADSHPPALARALGVTAQRVDPSIDLDAIRALGEAADADDPTWVDVYYGGTYHAVQVIGLWPSHVGPLVVCYPRFSDVAQVLLEPETVWPALVKAGLVESAVAR